MFTKDTPKSVMLVVGQVYSCLPSTPQLGDAVYTLHVASYPQPHALNDKNSASKGMLGTYISGVERVLSQLQRFVVEPSWACIATSVHAVIRCILYSPPF